ncbi:ANTAR domain-containing protein [Terrabacter sp. 2RAF25]|uniref:ANTAR domain-containing protein n=1 Tax=Terrabacter sp. 2RAF25 TaxID=3232998 RepID=UPI003F9D1D56
MEPHEAADGARGSAVGAGPDVGGASPAVRRTATGGGADLTAHVDAVFTASPGASRLTPVEAYLLEALDRLDTAETKATQLEAALAHSREIGAAVGVLMALRKLSREQAFDLLRRASMAQNVKVHVLAARVVETGSTDVG